MATLGAPGKYPHTPIGGGSYGPIEKNPVRFEDADSVDERVGVLGELALLRGALELVGIRADQLIERLDPVSATGNIAVAEAERELPPVTSKVGGELRTLMFQAANIAERLTWAAEVLRL